MTNQAYENLMNNYEVFISDAKAAIAKREAKRSNNAKRNEFIDAAVKQFQMVIDFKGTSDVALMNILSQVNVSEANSNHIIAALNQYKSVTGKSS